MKRKYYLVVAMMVIGAVQAAACSSKFDSCADSRTCPASAGGEAGTPPSADLAGSAGDSTVGSAGTAGAAGEGDGGAAGQPSAVACALDSDCSDDLACDGVETCRSRVCVAGVAPCANPEPEHCDAVCAEVNGAAACSVRGKDADKDGHYSSACTASPGDDCDDTAPTVYTGAPELCDGIDNNCNQKIDLDDGLPVGGTSVVVGEKASFASIAWATDKSVYGIVYNNAGAPSNAGDLYFEEVDKTGAVILTPDAINDATTRSGYGFDLSWGGDRFGVTWTASATVYLQTLRTDGTAPTAASYVLVNGSPSYPVVARIPGGNWAVEYLISGYSNGDATYYIAANTFSAAGLPGTVTPLTTTAIDTYNLAATATNFITAVSDVDNVGYTTYVDLRSSTLGSPQAVGVIGRDPTVAPGPNGFAVATRGVTDADPPRLAVFSADGSNRCVRTSFADKDFVPASAVATPKGYLIASGNLHFSGATTAVRVQEVFADCSLGPLFTVDAAPADDVKIAGGSDGYGLVWYDSAARVSKLRLLGPKYCD